MTIWSAEIKDLQSLFDSIQDRFPDLEKELQKLIKTDDENIVLVYSRRCLEVIITDLCECELNRPRKTEPLKGVIDKLSKEEKVPSNIIASMLNLNSLSAFGAHPKEFDPEQVKPVLSNLTIIIKWYLKYKDAQAINKPEEQVKNESVIVDDIKEGTHKPKKKSILLFSGLALVVVIVVVALFVFDIIGGEKQTNGLERSIAVLPFDNMSDSEVYNWFGDAFTDEIIMQLYKIRAFDVRSRTSIMQYKNTEKSCPTIGQELEVDYIVEGSAQRIEDQVRIRVQLIHASTDSHIWGDIYEGNSNDIIDIQINVAKQIAHKLRTVISPDEITQIEKKSTQNSKAYDLYLQGRHYWNLRTNEGVMNSIKYFEQAVKMDKEFALAYSGLADAYHILGDWYYMDPDSALKKARLFAIQSILIDSKIAEPYATLGWIFQRMSFDYELAEFMFKHSLQINPYYSTANQWYALFLTSVGRFNEAFNYMDIALNLDPESAIINYASGLMYYFAEEYDKALIQFNQTSRIDQNFPIIYYRLACYFQKEEYLEVISEYEKTLNGIFIMEGFHQNAEQILDNKGADGLIRYIIELEIQKENPNRLLLPALYAFIGENERTFDILESNINDEISDFLFIKVEPAFKKLHPEPRFKQLMKLIGR